MQDSPFKRLCDMCGQPYEMNNREVPRIIVQKKINVTDIISKDMYAFPDYCDLCILPILRFLQRRKELKFTIANRIIVSKR